MPRKTSQAEHTDERDSGGESHLSRRSWLKLSGVAATGALLSSGVVSAQSAEFPNTILVDARDADGASEYSFAVSEAVQPVESTDASADFVTDDANVAATAENALHAYHYSGNLVSFSIDGSAFAAFGEDVGSDLGGSAEADDGADSGSDDSDDGSGSEHQLRITSGSNVEYAFTTTGEIRKNLDAGDNSAEENNDSVTQNDDGTWTAEGLTGNGYGDSYTFTGEIVSFEPTTGSYSLVYDGSQTTAAELVGDSNELRIVSESDVDYAFTATGTVEKDLDAGDYAAEGDNDAVTENDDDTFTAEGMTGNGYGDTYQVAGDVVAFEPMTGSYTLTYDGTELTAAELTGNEAPTDDTGDASDDSESSDGDTGGANLGGGEGYPNTVSESEADYTAGSLSELESALGDAAEGQTVYVTGEIGVDSTITVPQGVTLASDRGIDGAEGGVLVADGEIEMLEVDGDSRITGLRLDGPMSTYESWDGYPAGAGIVSNGSGVEVDNCEIYGFAYAGVNGSNDEYVHHCDIHNNPQDGLGYGVDCTGGDQTIEYCTFNYNRHSVASSGSGSYTVRNNHFGPETVDHVIDVHPPGGETIIIENNTVEATEHVQDGGETEAVYIRGDVAQEGVIRNNWFYGSEPSDGGDPGEAVRTALSSWDEANVTLENNAYGSSEPSGDIGAPR
ncbi:right-handed parallel beta-helix repeat-containing protein [Halogeometricum luteum]|uniref:Right-handed parallel beta-helix repeat-containing protein n=1 Tax=Halogeometricum luteum TaxID=2950537 RepID=A0ABU2G380_9EURY|nr:right-handed parallel beta-helix repeat-containing protein [Halogeometricum sp. S3BR5-2]MDS0295235.1 right-handed parallel beta-helix repeat-containing protein [Halogeometricum sp. S3BR5-2]